MLKAAILIPMLAFHAAAQTPASKWDGLKMLAPGTEVRVASISTPAHRKPIQGALESVTDSELVLLQAGGPQTFARTQILSVSVNGKDHRVRNAFIGLGLGFAVGGGIGAAVGEGQAHNCRGLLCGIALPADAVAGGIVGIVGGTLAGVFWHTGGWHKIYTA
jgi:hypothetical protein